MAMKFQISEDTQAKATHVKFTVEQLDVNKTVSIYSINDCGKLGRLLLTNLAEGNHYVSEDVQVKVREDIVKILEFEFYEPKASVVLDQKEARVLAHALLYWATLNNPD